MRTMSWTLEAATASKVEKKVNDKQELEYTCNLMRESCESDPLPSTSN